ncbi:MAG TPA: phosphotransferase [Microlunatus sp.]
MINTVMPEMLWESTDADVELQRRFGFASVDAAAAWAEELLAEDYDLELTRLDRMVISAHNLMLWVTTAAADRLMIKVCRLTEAHDWLSARAALVQWLAEQELPVAAPLRTRSGDDQLLRDDSSIGVQPILPGELLDATDLDQVRAAGSTLATLHRQLAIWPDAVLLEDVQPVAGSSTLWAYPDGRAETVPSELRRRLEQRIVDLPELSRQPVHSDFRGANVLYGDGEITGVIDFEEARLDAAVVDLAHAVCLLGTWYRNWQPITDRAQRLFLDSYTERRPLTDPEQVWLAPLVGWGMLGQGWWEDAARWLR